MNLPRAFAAAVFGALAGAAFLVIAYGVNAGFTFRMDRDLPSQARGFYPVERDASGNFAWTRESAELQLPDIDRRVPWTCSIRFRGGRPDPGTLPDVRFVVEGAVVRTVRATNDIEFVEFTVPTAALRRSLTLGISVSNTFLPGSGDPRHLGVIVHEFGCRPAERAGVLPPRRALAGASLSAALFGAAFGLMGVTPGSAIGGAVLAAMGQAWPMSIGMAPYSPYCTAVAWLALATALVLVAAVWVTEKARIPRLRNTAKFVAGFSAVAFYLKLLVLVHPAKHIGDAMFHAHRLQSVLGGQYDFTSITSDLFQFPYAIALYVFAAPFTALTSDLVTLLRIIVVAADAVAGLALYYMVVRAWGDRLAGAGAVVLYHVVPLSFAAEATANLTNAFGQSVAMLAMACVTSPVLRPGAWRALVLATIAITVAMLSHTSTFATLFGSVLITTLLYRWRGGAVLRPAASAVGLSLLLATLVAVIGYYGHFGQVYREQASRLMESASVSQAATAAGSGAPAAPPPASAAQPHARTAADRAARVRWDLSVGFGWPIMLLAIAGAWRLWTGRVRDRLALALGGWTLACAMFLLLGIATPVEMRHYLAFYPAAAILGAVAAAWCWRRNRVPRALAVALLVWAVALGLVEWLHWIR